MVVEVYQESEHRTVRLNVALVHENQAEKLTGFLAIDTLSAAIVVTQQPGHDTVTRL